MKIKERKKHRKALIIPIVWSSIFQATPKCVLTTCMEIPIEEPSEAVPRRSERQRQRPDFYGIRVNQCSEKSSEPATIEEAPACSEISQK